MFSSKRRSFMAVTFALLFAVSNLTALTTFATPYTLIDFKLRTTDGGEITSEMLRGELVVLAFGASWLPLSRAQVQGVQKLSEQYAGRNIRVYWVSTDSESPKSKNYATDAQLRDFARKHGLKVAVLRDPEGKLLKELEVDQLPAIVILDRAGNVSGQPIGGLDPNRSLADQLGPKLDALLNQ